MKTLVYIGAAVVVTGAALALYLNWSINRMISQPEAQTCPVWLQSTPQRGC